MHAEAHMRLELLDSAAMHVEANMRIKLLEERAKLLTPAPAKELADFVTRLLILLEEPASAFNWKIDGR